MEENGHRRNGRNFWLGLLIGTVVSTGASMLYAPRSGAETRATIRKQATETRDQITNVVNRAKSRMAERRSKSERKAEELQYGEEKAAVG